MFKITLKGMWAHKRRLIGTVLAVVLGVGFLCGTLVLGDTLTAGFGDAFAQANEGTDAIVRSSEELSAGDSDLAERRWITDAAAEVDQISALEGVDAAVATVEGTGQIVAADGRPIGGQGPPTDAAAWVDDPRLNGYEVAEGTAPAAEGEVVIDKASAESGELAVGDTTTILTPQPVPVTIVGLVTAGGEDSLGGVSFVGFTRDQAEALLAPGPDQATAVRVAAQDGVSQRELADAIAPTLPEDQEVLTGDELTLEQKEDVQGDFLGFFNTLLVVFAGVAMLVAAFSIANTFAIITAQRTRESALLRALGASRRQILLSTTLEAVVLGLIASVLGVAAGIGLASLALSAVGAIGFPDSNLVLQSSTVITGMAVGLMVTVGASLAPAVRASRVSPLAAMRDVSTERVAVPRLRLVLGAVVTLAGVAAVLVGVSAASFSLVGLGAVASLVGVVALGLVVARPVARIMGSPLPLLKGTTGRLARENASRNPRRTASTASALLVGVTVVVVFTILGASIKASIDESVNTSFAGDLVVAPQQFSGAGLDPALATDIDDLDDVDAIGFSFGPILVDGEALAPSVGDTARIDQFIDVDVQEGVLTDVGEGGIALADSVAEDRGLVLGDTVDVAFSDGATGQLTVDALYGSTDLLGDAIISPATWDPHAQQRFDSIVVIDVTDGSIGDARTAIAPLVAQYAAPDPLDRAEYLDLVAGQINQALSIVYALLVLAVIIALMGIANTLSLSVFERTRELGLLRAVGQTRRQLRSMVRWESVLIALFGTLGGLALGTLLGWGLYKALAESEFGGNGAPTPLAIPIGSLLVIVALGAVVGVVAAAFPARRAARKDVLEAIAQS